MLGVAQAPPASEIRCRWRAPSFHRGQRSARGRLAPRRETGDCGRTAL